jgi:hypothetical protein
VVSFTPSDPNFFVNVMLLIRRRCINYDCLQSIKSRVTNRNSGELGGATWDLLESRFVHFQLRMN